MPLIKNLKIESIEDEDDNFFKVREINKEKRLTIYHWVVHILAFLILIPFLIMVIFQVKIPEMYSTIVSIVIGFYFARALFN